MKADAVYVDPSALTRLYLHQDGSREMSLWRSKVRGSVAVTHHGKVEIINAICRAAFLGHLSVDGAKEALDDLELDFREGALHQAEILWRAALNQAADLSRQHTPRLGVRSLDVLHVACALELKARYFLTFDHRQQDLAANVGLKAIRPSKY